MKLDDYKIKPPSPAYFETICQDIKDDFWGIPFNFKRSNRVNYVHLKPRFSKISSKYFISEGNKFPKQIIIKFGFDILKETTWIVRCDKIKDNTPTNIYSLRHIELEDSTFTKKITGDISVHLSNNFAFVGEIFLNKYQLSEIKKYIDITVLGIPSYDRKKESWGWKAFSL